MIVFKERHWLLFIVIGFIAVLGPGRIEGLISPAAPPMKLTAFKQGTYIEEISGIEKKMMLIWGTSERLRPRCNFRRLEWFLGDRDGRNVPVNSVTGKPQVRPDDVFDFGPWFIVVESLGDLIENSHADVLHRCYYWGIPSLWLTRSKFWN